MSSENGNRRELSVGIVGAGFGGLGMGARLAEQGIREFTVFERGDSVGGVWRANTYPGAACDVPSHLYSFSFATGASAIQFVPEIAPLASELVIYQRSAPWLIPKSDRAYSEWERRVFRQVPPRVALSRLGNFSFLEAFTYGFTGSDWVMKPIKA